MKIVDKEEKQEKMNNRLKFRVWDNAENKYNGFSFHLAMSGELDRLSVDGDLLEADPNRFTVEQSTGIADKNGKLIYEGDILRATCTDGKHIDYPVGWWDGAFHLYYVDKSLIAETGTIQFCLRGLVSVKNCCYREIIGNIHDDHFRDLTKMAERN